MHDVPARPSPDTSIVAPVSAPPAVAARGVRNVAVDAYRGFVMFLMMAEVLQLAQVAAGVSGQPRSSDVPRLSPDARRLGRLLAARSDSALVLVPGRRRARRSRSRVASAEGRLSARLFAHAAWRSLLLVVLGVFLRSVGARRPTSPSRTRCRRSAWAIRSCSCWRSSPTRRQWIALGVILGRLLGGLCAVPAAGAGFRLSRQSAYRPTGRTTTPASRRTGTRTANLGLGVRHLVPQPVPARSSRSSPTAAATRR